jgi:hypothetical protein
MTVWNPRVQRALDVLASAHLGLPQGRREEVALFLERLLFGDQGLMIALECNLVTKDEVADAVLDRFSVFAFGPSGASASTEALEQRRTELLHALFLERE